MMRRRIALLVVLLMVSCTWNTLHKKEVETMKAAFTLRYGGKPALWPVVVGLKEELDIFSVPTENAVGTNSMNNAITLLRFAGDQIQYDEVKRDFIEGVGSGDKYYPGIFSDEWIGYTQTRGFLLFNLREKTFADHIPVKSGDQYFKNVAVFDAQKLQFVFHVHEAYFHDGIRYLKLLEFDGKGGYITLSEIKTGKDEVGYSEPWAIQNKTIFIYNNDSTRITAYDMQFTPVAHPFCDLFNNLKDFRRLDQLVIHPTLPIAILVEIKDIGRGGYKVYLANWGNPDPEKQFIELLAQEISLFSGPEINRLSVSGFQFSPGGDWLVFRDNSERTRSVTNPLFVAMPVDGSKQLPLGKPHILGKVLRENAYPTSTAWIKQPVSFVVCDGQVVYKWELGQLAREFGE
ncbi:MAG: hypothetical protein JW863_01975 [Chitinispirillaceae bacterium]|nr:hypothetical protein [Chitinispirillaceae bacterium]